MNYSCFDNIDLKLKLTFVPFFASPPIWKSSGSGNLRVMEIFVEIFGSRNLKSSGHQIFGSGWVFGFSVPKSQKPILTRSF